MARCVVILGGGTGGTAAANRLRRRLGDGVSIVPVDHDDRHIYQFSLPPRSAACRGCLR